MIPFNLERAKQGVPICTREGVHARFITHLDGGQPAPLVVEVMLKQRDKQRKFISGSTMTENYYIDGRHGPVHDSEFDLFMKY